MPRRTGQACGVFGLHGPIYQATTFKEHFQLIALLFCHDGIVSLMSDYSHLSDFSVGLLVQLQRRPELLGDFKAATKQVPATPIG